ncbi:PspC domain-containing protein [Aeromonas caviae]|nr:PspC domain-containing protein [Aeromonas caviae]
MALAVYLDPFAAKETPCYSNVNDTSYDGFYRSSDDKVLAGVCAGLAHKWKVSRTGLRFVTFLLTFFVGVPLFIYIICWIVFSARPTMNVR